MDVEQPQAEPLLLTSTTTTTTTTTTNTNTITTSIGTASPPIGAYYQTHYHQHASVEPQTAASDECLTWANTAASASPTATATAPAAVTMVGKVVVVVVVVVVVGGGEPVAVRSISSITRSSNSNTSRMYIHLWSSV
ncbi:hypothetical protein M0802_007996 [Mischocyttarus mexicanus]|nr:hypothetical protein M0802_007996 [Mischocyttarus mexicanus]